MRRRSTPIDVESGEPGEQGEPGVPGELGVPGEPRTFLRAGRRYAVTEVLSTWREAGVWWRTADGAARLDVAEDVGRRVWRVEAVPVRGGSAVVVDLVWEPSGWSLSRVVD